MLPVTILYDIISLEDPVKHFSISFLINPSRPDQFISYVDGISQGPPVAVQGLNFQLSTTPATSGQGVLFVGGVRVGIVTEIDDVPPFSGCLSDFAYNFG